MRDSGYAGVQGVVPEQKMWLCGLAGKRQVAMPGLQGHEFSHFGEGTTQSALIQECKK